jgi:RNA recognition motif-containing protein
LAINERRLIADEIIYSESTSVQKKTHYAFVDLATPSEAKPAIDELSGHKIFGRKIQIELARDKPRVYCDKSENPAIGTERVSMGEENPTFNNEATGVYFGRTTAGEILSSSDAAKETEDRLGQDLEDEEHSSTHDVILEVPPTPSTPPPRYTWVLTLQWILSRRDSPPPLSSHV